MGFTDVPSSLLGTSDAQAPADSTPRLQFAHSVGPSGQQLTVGLGPQGAELMFVGVANSAHDHFDGHRVVGPAFDLLTAMIEKGMKRSPHDVFVSWMIHCNSHDQGLGGDDYLTCLSRQIEWVSPKVVVLMGARALQVFRPDLQDVGRYRGQWIELVGRSALPTFHPEFLLRQPQAKREAWQDLKRVMERLGWS